MEEWAVRVRAWTPPSDWRRFETIEVHAAGEPLRVILAGFPEVDGTSALARRRRAAEHHDSLRRALMWEPRGHADMYGCIVLPPASPRGDFSVLFTHNGGFSTMCGHGVIGVCTALLECGALPAREGHNLLRIDAPAGFIEAFAQVERGRVIRVAFVNVPSFVARDGATVDVDGIGRVGYDLAYGGAFYAYVPAADFGLDLVPAEHGRLVELGRAIKNALQRSDPPHHPDDPDLGFVYGTIFVGPARAEDAHSRNVCVFADGEVDRSPTGTGVSGRLAIHHARGEIRTDDEIVVESILGTRFAGRVLREERVGGIAAVVPEVSGRAWVTGRSEVLIAPDDPLGQGFLLR